jgi:hypothetical protein
MNPLRSFFLRLRNLSRKTELDRDLDDELATHLELHIADNIRAGMNSHEARRVALLKRDGLEQTKESVRYARGIPSSHAIHSPSPPGLQSLPLWPSRHATSPRRAARVDPIIAPRYE